MARLLPDERPVTEDDNEVTDINETQQEAQPEPTPEPAEQDDIPEKYKGKSTAEIVRMHQEAEKLLGKQSGEVGELRKVVDDYITTQLDTTAPAQTSEPAEEIDWYSDPQQAMEQAISNHPSVKKAEETAVANARSTAMSQLKANHPDMETIVKDPKFVEWIKASKIRTQLFAQADRNYDFDAANELFSNWKERQGAVAKTVAAEQTTRKQAINKASTGRLKGSAEKRPKKVYRRSDIIKLMKEDPKRYLDLSDEITRAYAENRVR